MKANQYAPLKEQMITRMMLLLGATNQVEESTWYQDWGKLVAAIALDRRLTVEHGAAIFAALSPRKSIARNWAMYLTVLDHGPDACREATRYTRRKVAAMLVSDNPKALLVRKSGPKTWAFCENLLGNHEPVTVDSIMGQLAMDEPLRADVPKPMYRVIEEAIQHVAGLMHWTPANTQAALWIAAREAKPKKTGRKIDPNPCLLYAQLITPESVPAAN